MGGRIRVLFPNCKKWSKALRLVETISLEKTYYRILHECNKIAKEKLINHIFSRFGIL